MENLRLLIAAEGYKNFAIGQNIYCLVNAANQYLALALFNNLYECRQF